MIKKALATARSPLAVFLLLSFALVAFVFYATPFHSHVEEYLFDARSRLKPKLKDVPDVVLVTIDDLTIVRLEGAGAKELGIGRLRQLTDAVARTKARQVGLLFFPNVFDFDDPAVPDFLAHIAQDERFRLGTLGAYGDAPSGIDLPAVLEPMAQRSFGADTFKKRSNSVVRAMPLSGYYGLTLRPLLPRVLAETAVSHPVATEAPARLLSEGQENGDWYLLNFLAHDSFTHVDAADLIEAPEKYAPQLDGKTVIIGQTAFREWMTQTREQMAANTSLKGDPDTYKKGESIVYLTANATENLLTDSWLHPLGVWATIVQTVLVTGLFAAIWALGVVPALLTVTGMWVVLLLLHGALFHYFAVFVPLADTALCSSFALLVGAMVRLNLDIRSQAAIRTETEAKSALAKQQSRHLDQFSLSMAAANERARTRLSQVAAAVPAGSPDKDLLDRALSTSVDFAEYLDGIMQCAEAEGDEGKRVRFERVRLAPLIATVSQRLDAKLKQRPVSVVVECPDDLTAYSNGPLLDHIIFNLLSNAVKYSREGGHVKVSAAPQGRGVLITVADDGPGIAPEFHEKIFEKFYRVKNDDVYKIKGTGLGLYLCRFFARRIGATVRVESEIGRGATFLVELGKRR
jgi:signal transduction histidine kinase